MERDNLGGGEQADALGDDQPDEHGRLAGDAAAAHGSSIPAPQLRETADIWFDSGVDPAIRWDREGRRFELIDPQAAADGYQGDEPDEASDRSLLLYEAPYPLPDPARIAQVLADGLAACDFPPTAERAHPGHVASALRAANIDPDAP